MRRVDRRLFPQLPAAVPGTSREWAVTARAGSAP
jgi:hypothetical protein